MEFEEFLRSFWPLSPSIEVYILIASLVTNATVFLGVMFNRGLKRNILVISLFCLLVFIIPYTVLLIDCAFGGIGIYNNISVKYEIEICGRLPVPYATTNIIAADYLIQYWFQILIADAAGILAGFGIWYYVKKKLKVTDS